MKKLSLRKIDPDDTHEMDKEVAHEKTQKNLKKMYDLLHLMYAEDKRSLLIILQGIDASGKDSVVQKIFSGANPQGIQAYSFKEPSLEELRHDFLWRCHNKAPQSGMTAVFNRSYYEEVTTLMVHPPLLENEHLPREVISDKNFFKKRYSQINDFEKMLSENGTIVLKFFLHISKKEQMQRFEDRIQDSTKNWKFSEADMKERKYWTQYMSVFEKMLTETNSSIAPWKIIPANKKWYRDYLVSKAIVERLSQVEMTYPKISSKLKKLR